MNLIGTPLSLRQTVRDAFREEKKIPMTKYKYGQMHQILDKININNNSSFMLAFIRFVKQDFYHI